MRIAVSVICRDISCGDLSISSKLMDVWMLHRTRQPFLRLCQSFEFLHAHFLGNYCNYLQYFWTKKLKL